MTAILRAGLLEATTVVVAGAGELGGAVAARAAALGAARATAGPADVLVWDGAAAFVAGGTLAVLDGAWEAIRAVEAPLILLLAPPAGDAHAEAARAGLENLARTLSIEWARRGVRTVAIWPGAAGEVAELAAFLASPAGAYYSGCRFDLG